MASQIASLEEDKQAYLEQLEIVLQQLKDDGENAELRALKAELDDMIGLINESISELRPKQAPSKPSPPAVESAPAATQGQEKWSRENHPAFKQNSSAPTLAQPPAPAEEKEEEIQVSYQVNEDVLAKWLSGDKKFWPARITSITGSSTSPIYIVKFKSYKGTETLRAKDIRPASNKRKADGPPATTTMATPSPATTRGSAPPNAAHSFSGPQFGLTAPLAGSHAGAILSAAPSLYPEQLANREAEQNARDVKGKPPKPKKIKAKKELEAGKNKWQDFNNKSKFAKSSHKKESMFRTPEGIHGRVGFTGSGQAMRKDPTRSRHIYQTNEEGDQ